MSDLTVDYGNALASETTPGVSDGALERPGDRVADAHETIATGMAENSRCVIR